MVHLVSSLFLAAMSATAVLGAQTCSPTSKCPSDKPCCSQYGECGTGAYCLGGCDPLSSFQLGSCAPAPVCEDKTYSWDNLDDTASNTKYLGNASESDWVYSGQPLTKDGNLLLTMANGTVGTLFANNHYIWYGKVSGKVKSSRGKGVVTAFILLSDVKDEIDFEFVGSDLNNVQTNYYFQGILDYDNGGKSNVSGDTFDTWHTYEFDWTPDHINWIVDGNITRTLTKESTWNATKNRYDYPQTPSRLQLSLWPAGLSSNGEGTIEWAGGLVNWDSEDIQKYGYYYATYGDITVQCYDPPTGANVQGNTSYIYTDSNGLNSSIELTNKDTVLASFSATGTNMSIGASSSTASASASGNSSTGSDTVPSSGNGGAGGNSSNSGSGSGSGSSSSGSATATGFSQGGTATDSSKSGAPVQNERVLQSSLFAVLVAMVVLVTM